MSTTTPEQKTATTLEGGTYELLRNRIKGHVGHLEEKLLALNEERKQVFGTIETKVLATERVTTANNCVPWDLVSFESYFLFGYNVHMGLKSEVTLSDVFSLYEYKDQSFHEKDVAEMVNNKVFLDDFSKLYKYYKDTQFLRFKQIGPYLHMVFRIGKEVTDVKTFKWQIEGRKLTYIDNRSDHEYRFPNQQEFNWKRTKREDFREGQHPHISIQDRVFVECVGGDLTVKIEDNTNDGEGIYREDVVHKEQTLEDAAFQYADLGSIIVIKASPYQEEDRYLVFNEKLKEVRRIDSIKDACVLLPDDHGLIFSDGYYLQSGEYKRFDLGLTDMLYERSIPSINGEDYLYVFYNRLRGVYLLLTYNLISQKVENPIICHGFTIFENGEMCLFKTDEEPKKHHTLQIWQTPYTGPNFHLEEQKESYLKKIGNKEVVRAMAECQEVITLLNRNDIYSDLYVDVIKKTTDIIDSYYWLAANEQFQLATPLQDIRTVATSTVDEYEKVRKLQESATDALQDLSKKKTQVLKKSKGSFSKIDRYVELLGEIRKVRGEVISAKSQRYIDVSKLEVFDQELAESSDTVSTSCIRFLSQEHALEPYREKVAEFKAKIETITKVVDGDELMAKGEEIASQLNLLIETVSNLKITDATQTTQIIESISEIYGQYNQVKGALVAKRKSLLSTEAKSEFEATLKLLEQSVSNYIDISDTPEQCDDYLTKMALQIEELEAKFSDFTAFLEKIEEKREEVYNAFEAKKLYLTEQRNKKSNQLFQAAERVLSAIKNKSKTLASKEEINGYFASDLMAERIRSIAQQLVDLGDSVKSDDLTSQLKSLKEDSLRQLKDKEELFVGGDNIIKLGAHHFYTNNMELELSIVNKNNQPCYHLIGTDFFEPINNEVLTGLSNLWDQTIISENDEVYRAEYLVYELYLLLERKVDKETDLPTTIQYLELSEADQLELVRGQMVKRYQEGYVKGIHEFDVHTILSKLLEVIRAAGVLSYPSEVRALGTFFWNSCLEESQKKLLGDQIKAASIILSVFPTSREFEGIIKDIEVSVSAQSEALYNPDISAKIVATYLFDELAANGHFTISAAAANCYHAFSDYLTKKRSLTKFQKSVDELKNEPKIAIRLIQNWLHAFLEEKQELHLEEVMDEVSMLLFYKDFSESRVRQLSLEADIQGLKGAHELIEDGNYHFHLTHFLQKMDRYKSVIARQFLQLQQLKKELTVNYKSELKLDEFKPRVLSSFVRNQLIDKVYFPLIGANLAKQMGTAGEAKRTDLMGLLLLISPPGYGKTTLMEYIASRLGIIFMKINGPAIGHEVTSLDPADAPNAASAQELMKLNLSFEMGNNVMIYLDDIQHCNPELLQKFISMCDAQRKIEGVYKGKTRTYDFRGKKVCVVMAGNPYTESGDKFQIPDMLSNRADIYNLGDVIGDTEDTFNLSYLENCLTSNPILARLVSRSMDDVYAVFDMVKRNSTEGIKFEASHTAEELQEYATVIEHLMTARDVILKVNMQYIQSAAIAEEYRVEPAFKLQGSYRDMNKIAEKILPVMNEKEVDTLIFTHYENEAQTLTSDAEANLLKFKMLVDKVTPEDEERWQYILEKFAERQRRLGHGQNAMLAEGVGDIANSLKGILEKMGGGES